MSSIRNWVTCPGPSTPELLQGKLEFVANYKITQREADMFSSALKGICQQLEEDGIQNSDLTRVTALFTKNGGFEFVDEADDKSLGLHFSLAVYSMANIREKTEVQGDGVYFIVFIEELVHHYWRLEDEVETKIKVTDVFNKIIGKQLEVSDIFPKDWLNAELIRQGKQARY